MPTNFPTSLDAYTAHVDNVSENILAAHVNNLQDAMVAVERHLLGVAINPHDAAYGAVGNGVADDTAALQAALNDASTTKRPLVLKPGAVYGTSSFLEINSDTTVVGYGAKIKALATHTDDQGRMTRIRNNKSNVKIYGLEIDGSKSLFAFVTEYKHGIMIDYASHVWIVDCYIHDCKGEGIALEDNFGPISNNHNYNIVIEDCRLENNHRNNLSISDGTHVRVRGTRMIGATGTAPMAGCDIETHYTESVVEDVEFTGCDFRGNTSYGLLVAPLVYASTGREASFRFHGCTMQGNGTGIWVQRARSVTFVGCESRGNTTGVLLDWQCRDIQFLGGAVSENLRWGVIGQDNTGAGPLEGVRFVGVEVYNNSRTTPGADQGFLLYGNWTDLLIMGCRVTGNGVGISTASTMSRVRLIGNDLTGNATGPVSLADAAASRIVAHNNGYVSAASGAFSYTTGAASRTVTHGLGGTPARVVLTPTGDPGTARFWVSAKGATTFTISCSVTTQACAFDWRAYLFDAE